MKGYTELVFILDRSGSMSGLEADTIGGFNSLLKKQKQEEGKAVVSTILFDDTCEVIHNRVPLEQIRPMTEKDYYVRGCTALLDAVGGAVCHISKIHREMRPEDRPEKTMFIITTDGMENSSREYSYSTVKSLIEKHKCCSGWEFLFLGANIDAVAEAGRFGISADHAVEYCCDSRGTALNYRVLNAAVSQVRACSCLAPSWKSEIDRDMQSRRHAPEQRRKRTFGLKKS